MSKVEDIADRAKAGTLPTSPANESVPVRPLRSVPAGERDPVSAAERALVGSILWAGKYEPVQHRAKAVESIVEPRMFRVAAWGAAFAAMLALEAMSAPTEPVAVASEARRAGAALEHSALDGLTAEATAPTPEKLTGWARAIRTGWLWRELEEAERVSLQGARAQHGTPAEALDGARSRLDKIAESLTVGSRTLSAAQAAKGFVDMVNGAAKPFATGFTAIDDATGGFRPRETSIISARTSVGKSALSAQIARNMVTLRPDVACLYVSLEMSAPAFVARLVAADAGIHARKLRRPDTMTPLDWSAYIEGAKQIGALGMHFVDSTQQTLASVQSAARELVALLRPKGKRLAMIVIDHIGLIKPSSELLKRANREQQVAETSRGLRYLAETFDCHVTALVQIGREAEKTRKPGDMPRLHQLRESDAIAADADSVFILHRERDEKTGMWDASKPPALALAKARHDEITMMLLSFEPKYVRFGNHLDATTFYDHYGKK